ncbi:hypothetical protein KM043_005264 [Ampulex compressa]|nr:hypothetical protein KM043_005264 [Ampulex compressa]
MGENYKFVLKSVFVTLWSCCVRVCERSDYTQTVISVSFDFCGEIIGQPQAQPFRTVVPYWTNRPYSVRNVRLND